MNKPTITDLFLYSDGSIEIKITEDTDQVTTITLTSEKMKGLDMDQRYEAAKKRAQSYIACVEKENQVIGEPFADILQPGWDAPIVLKNDGLIPRTLDMRVEDAMESLASVYRNNQSRAEVNAQSELS